MVCRGESVKYLLHGSLALISSDGGLGLLSPALFSAMTLNWYMLPSMRSVIFVLVVVMTSLTARIQRPLVPEHLSRRYPVIGDPPSLVGGCHDTSQEVLQASLTTGAAGASGTSVNEHVHI